MKRNLLILIILVILAAGAWYVWSRVPHSPLITGITPPAKEVAATQSGTALPELSVDLYPLYGKVAWETSKTESLVIGTTTYAGTSIASVAVADTMDPGSVFTPFEKYYKEKLEALGWKSAMEFDAGGHVGGQTGYRKGNSIILTRFNIVYHTVSSTSPSECPCDVSLSLFSSK